MADDYLKRGKFGVIEDEYLQNHYSSRSYEEMGEHLKRHPDTVRRRCIKLGLGVDESKLYELNAEFDIKSRPYWAEICSQFPEEKTLFLYHWKRIVAQFKDDITATEEMQILNLVKINLLSNRILNKQAQVNRELSVLERELQEARDANDIHAIEQLQVTIGSLRSADTDCYKSFKDLSDKEQNILTKMKATREQRVKQIESNKQSFMGFVKQVYMDDSLRYNLGIDMEKMRLAAEAERTRLSAPHKYMDDTIDCPFYTPEVALKLKEEGEKQDNDKVSNSDGDNGTDS